MKLWLRAMMIVWYGSSVCAIALTACAENTTANEEIEPRPEQILEENEYRKKLSYEEINSMVKQIREDIKNHTEDIRMSTLMDCLVLSNKQSVSNSVINIQLINVTSSNATIKVIPTGEEITASAGECFTCMLYKQRILLAWISKKCDKIGLLYKPDYWSVISKSELQSIVQEFENEYNKCEGNCASSSPEGSSVTSKHSTNDAGREAQSGPSENREK